MVAGGVLEELWWFAELSASHGRDELRTFPVVAGHEHLTLCADDLIAGGWQIAAGPVLCSGMLGDYDPLAGHLDFRVSLAAELKFNSSFEINYLRPLREISRLTLKTEGDGDVQEGDLSHRLAEHKAEVVVHGGEFLT